MNIVCGSKYYSRFIQGVRNPPKPTWNPITKFNRSIVNPVVSGLTDYIAVPATKLGYGLVCRGITAAASQIGSRVGGRTEGFLQAPISSRTVHFFASWSAWSLGFVSGFGQVPLPGLRQASQLFLSLVQHAHVFVRDIETLTQLPSDFENALKKGATFSRKGSTLLTMHFGWTSVRCAMQAIAGIFFGIAWMALQAYRLVGKSRDIQPITDRANAGLKGLNREWKRLSIKIDAKILGLVWNREGKVRKQASRMIANACSRIVVDTAIRSVIYYGAATAIYCGVHMLVKSCSINWANHRIADQIATCVADNFFRLKLGGSLVAGVLPLMGYFYRSYTPHFDVDKVALFSGKGPLAILMGGRKMLSKFRTS